jgi:hypothetical protein
VQNSDKLIPICHFHLLHERENWHFLTHDAERATIALRRQNDFYDDTFAKYYEWLEEVIDEAWLRLPFYDITRAKI